MSMLRHRFSNERGGGGGGALNHLHIKVCISLTALPFHRELQLINYQDFTQDTLFI